MPAENGKKIWPLTAASHKKGNDNMSNEEYKVLRGAIDKFGIESQTKMLLEEMSELQKEVCKMWRGQCDIEHIAEEVADVEIMLDQLKMMHGIEHEVMEQRGFKIHRLKEMLGIQYDSSDLPDGHITACFAPDKQIRVETSGSGKGLVEMFTAIAVQIAGIMMDHNVPEGVILGMLRGSTVGGVRIASDLKSVRNVKM